MKLLKKLFLLVTGLWIFSMIVYFFNLDMKLTSALYPYIDKWYDRVERDKKL